MPHTRSAEGKRLQASKRREAKWLKCLEAAAPVLCRRLYEKYSKMPGFSHVLVYPRTSISAPISGYLINQSENVRRNIPSMDLHLPNRALDCYIVYRNQIGLIDCYRCFLEFNVLSMEGLAFPIERLKTNSQTPDSVCEYMYTWIQDTIRGELCRLRSERMREELVAAVWHPRRVAKRLEEGGWDAVEGM